MKTRTQIQQGDVEKKQYFINKSALIAHYQTERAELQIPDKELKNYAFRMAIKELW